MDQELCNILLQVSRLPQRHQTLALARIYHASKGDSRVQKIMKLRPLPVDKPDFAKVNCIKVAIKFNYDGSKFGGLALQAQDSQLLTVENFILEALRANYMVPRDMSEKVF